MSDITIAPPTRRIIGRTHEVRADGTRIHLRTCPLCECMCGLELHFDADARVKRIRAYRDDVRSKGYLCPKGTTLGHLHQDPDRVRVPLIRDGDRFRDATWPLDRPRARGGEQQPPRDGRVRTRLSGNAAVNGIPVEIVPA